MASSSNTLSSALHLDHTPNLTLNEEQRKSLEAVYQGNSVFVWLPTLFGKNMIEYKKGQRGSKSYALVLYPKLLLVFTRQYYAASWLRSTACLELVRFHYPADTRLSPSRLPTGEPGNEPEWA